MARIAGVTVPTEKQIQYSLTYIYGIGLKTAIEICNKCGVDPQVRVRDMNESELTKIRDEIRNNFTVEGELQRIVTANIKRLKDINSYRGSRHKANLPARGQRTRTNARTKRGKRVAVGGVRPKAATKT